MNPYLTQRYGSAMHQVDEEPDGSVGWGRFPASTHMQHTFFSAPNRTPPAKQDTPKASASPIPEVASPRAEEPQTAAATRRQSEPDGGLVGAALFAPLKFNETAPVKTNIATISENNLTQLTTYLHPDVEAVLSKRLSRRAPLSILPLDPIQQAVEEEERVVTRGIERQELARMQVRLDDLHTALQEERRAHRRDLKEAKHRVKHVSHRKRSTQAPLPRSHSEVVSPEMLGSIVASIYASMPRAHAAPSLPTPEPAVAEPAKDAASALAKRVDEIYGAKTTRREGAHESKPSFAVKPLPRVNVPPAADVFFSQSEEGRSMSPLALPTPETSEHPQQGSIPRYLLPTESWLCKGPELQGVHLHPSCESGHHHHHQAESAAEETPQSGGLARALRLGRNDAPKSVRPFKP